MPLWGDIQPSAIRTHLPKVWSYAYNANTDQFVGRLAGEHVTALFGNLRGLPMSEANAREHSPSLIAKCKRVVSEPALYHGGRIDFRIAGKSYVGEWIILPLSNNGNTCDGVFGATDIPPFFPGQVPEMSLERKIEGWFMPSGARRT
jgi:hypothetical protein